MIVDDGFVFDLYSSDCLDKVIVPCNSRILVWEFSGFYKCVNSPRQIFVSADFVFLFLSLCRLCLIRRIDSVSQCISLNVFVHMCVHTYFRGIFHKFVFLNRSLCVLVWVGGWFYKIQSTTIVCSCLRVCVCFCFCIVKFYLMCVWIFYEVLFLLIGVMCSRPSSILALFWTFH